MTKSTFLSLSNLDVGSAGRFGHPARVLFPGGFKRHFEMHLSTQRKSQLWKGTPVAFQ